MLFIPSLAATSKHCIHSYTTLLLQQNRMLKSGLKTAYQKLMECKSSKIENHDDAGLHDILEILGVPNSADEPSFDAIDDILERTNSTWASAEECDKSSKSVDEIAASKKPSLVTTKHFVPRIDANHIVSFNELPIDDGTKSLESMTLDLSDFSDPEPFFPMDDSSSGYGLNSFSTEYQADGLDWHLFDFQDYPLNL